MGFRMLFTFYKTAPLNLIEIVKQTILIYTLGISI